MSYNTLLTLAGRETVAQALSGGRPAAINWMAFGDGVHEPTGFETTLVHEVHRVAISSVRVDPNNPTWVIVEAVIPTHVGGFNILEVGVFDTQGKMFAIANYPPVYKPLMTEGVARDLKVRLYLEVGGKQTVNLIMRNCCGDNVYVDGCNQDYPKIKEMIEWNTATAAYLDRLTIGTGKGNCSESDCLALVDALASYNSNASTYLNVLEPCVASAPIDQNPNQYPTQAPTASPTPPPTPYPTQLPTSAPLPQVGLNDIEITDPRKGLILRSPNGTRYRVTVQDNGALTTTEVQ